MIRNIHICAYEFIRRRRKWLHYVSLQTKTSLKIRDARNIWVNWFFFNSIQPARARILKEKHYKKPAMSRVSLWRVPIRCCKALLKEILNNTEKICIGNAYKLVALFFAADVEFCVVSYIGTGQKLALFPWIWVMAECKLYIRAIASRKEFYW